TVCLGTTCAGNRALAAGPAIAVSTGMLRNIGLATTLLALGCGGSTDGTSATSALGVDECHFGAIESCVQANHEVGSRSCQPGANGYVWGSCEAASCSGNEQKCMTSTAEDGVAACVDGKTASACGVVGECHPGQMSTTCPGQPCKLMGDSWAF